MPKRKQLHMKKTKTVGKLAVIVLAVVSIVLFAPYSRGQSQAGGKRKITGSVRARLTDEMITGATVTIKGTTNMVSTDMQGIFTIEAQHGDVLVVTSVGYMSREFKVGNSSSFDLRVDQDYNRLEDVVVVGYGKMKKTDLSSSQVTVTAAEM